MEKRKLRAVVWAAVSSKPQVKKKMADGEEEDKESLPEQLAEGRAYAERMGWQVVGELSVPGHSREYIHYHDAAQEIEAYAELERLAEERAFDVLIARGRDRLGRTDAIIATAEGVCRQAGAQVLSLAVPTPIRDKPDRADLYLSAIERAQAEGELLEFRRRHKSGMRGRTLSGKPPSNLPYPYVRGGDGEPVLPADRLAVMRRIFEMFVNAGHSYGRICRTLNGERIPSPRGGAWGPATIRLLLANPFLRGIVVYGRHTRPEDQQIAAPSRYPAVFTADEAAAIDAEVARRGKLRKAATSPRPWTGIVFCARCGRSMNCLRSGQRYAYYRCGYHHRQREQGMDACHSNYTRLEKIQAAAQVTLAYYTDEAALDEALARLNAGHERQQMEQRLEELAEGIARVEAERERLTTAYLRAILRIDEYEERMAELAASLLAQEQERAALARRVASLPDMALRKEELRALIPQALKALVEGADPEASRRILHQTFRGIYCEDGDVVRVELL